MSLQSLIRHLVLYTALTLSFQLCQLYIYSSCFLCQNPSILHYFLKEIQLLWQKQSHSRSDNCLHLELTEAHHQPSFQIQHIVQLNSALVFLLPIMFIHSLMFDVLYMLLPQVEHFYLSFNSECKYQTLMEDFLITPCLNRMSCSLFS